jgi:heme/copper-type cytochrome/quinol oxidase subunit 4
MTTLYGPVPKTRVVPVYPIFISHLRKACSEVEHGRRLRIALGTLQSVVFMHMNDDSSHKVYVNANLATFIHLRKYLCSVIPLPHHLSEM